MTPEEELRAKEAKSFRTRFWLGLETWAHDEMHAISKIGWTLNLEGKIAHIDLECEDKRLSLRALIASNWDNEKKQAIASTGTAQVLCRGIYTKMLETLPFLPTDMQIAETFMAHVGNLKLKCDRKSGTFMQKNWNGTGSRETDIININLVNDAGEVQSIAVDPTKFPTTAVVAE